MVVNPGFRQQLEPVAQPDERNDHATGDKESLVRAKEIDIKWQKEQYIEEKHLPDQHPLSQPPMVLNPGFRQQLEPVAQPDERNDDATGDKESLARAIEIDNKWQKEQYREEKYLPDQHPVNQPPIVVNPGFRQQLEPVTQPVMDERNDHATGDKESLVRVNEIDNRWRKDQYIEEKSLPDQDPLNQPPMVVNPGFRQQLEPVAQPVMAQSLLNKGSDNHRDATMCGCNLL